jgi:Tol biopolymer transport system component
MDTGDEIANVSGDPKPDANGDHLIRLTANNTVSDSNPAWSPDGKRIELLSSRDRISGEIYVMNPVPAGVDNQPLRLTDNLACDFVPSWSSDGSQIAFDSDRDGNRDIYVMNADGRRQTRLTK